MSKNSRKIKWKGVPLNHSNIDEYMQDLIGDTTGQYITQGVSFNKEDNFQMNLLKNSILAHGSFSGFVKNLLFVYFEKNGSLDDSVWQPNTVSEHESATKEEDEKSEEINQVEGNDEVSEPLPVEKVTNIKKVNKHKRNTNANAFLPQK